MLHNLVAEMARKSITRYDLAELLGISYGTAVLKVNGNYEFSVAEAKKIKEVFFPDLSIEYLFSKEKYWEV